MNLELEITKHLTSTTRIELKIESGICTFMTFDYLNSDKMESLELQLTEIVQKLYDYRKQQEQLENDAS